MLLRQLVREKEVIGDVLSIEHVEPVGWWHFSHSYVRYVSCFSWKDLSPTTEDAGAWMEQGQEQAARRFRPTHQSAA